MISTPHIVTCPQWDARKPKHPPVQVGRPERIVFHHTDGHAPQLHPQHDLGLEDAILYAKALQNDMMDRRGWNDSGHNFLVMRTGIILQGRWGSVTAIEHGRMIESAHCPGQNDQPGIEHEHMAGEQLTAAQINASVWLSAWICSRTGIRPTQIFPHDLFFPTACPSNLAEYVPHYRLLVVRSLNYWKKGSPSSASRLRTGLALRRELRR